MKRQIFFLALLFYCQLTTYAQQHYMLGAKTGLNLSQLIGDGENNFKKKGLNGGLFFNLYLSKKLTAQIEILYTQKGCLNRFQPPVNFIRVYEFKIRYFEFPLVIQYHVKKICVESGLGAAIFIEKRQAFYMTNGIVEVTNDNPVNSIDKIFHVGISYIKNNWVLNCRYTNSILPIRKQPSAQYNSTFSLTVGYRFLFPKSKVSKEDG